MGCFYSAERGQEQGGPNGREGQTGGMERGLHDERVHTKGLSEGNIQLAIHQHQQLPGKLERLLNIRDIVARTGFLRECTKLSLCADVLLHSAPMGTGRQFFEAAGADAKQLAIFLLHWHGTTDIRHVINWVNRRGEGGTPLIAACKADNIEAVQLLLRTPRLKVDIPDEEGATAVIHAAARQSAGILRELLDWPGGADLDKRATAGEYAGKSAADIATGEAAEVLAAHRALNALAAIAVDVVYMPRSRLSYSGQETMQMNFGTAAQPFHLNVIMPMPPAWIAGQLAQGMSTAEYGGLWLHVYQYLRALDKGLVERTEQAWKRALDRLVSHGDYVDAGAYSRAEAAEDCVGSFDSRVLLSDDDDDGAFMYSGAGLRRTRCKLSLMDAAVFLKEEKRGDEEASRHKTFRTLQLLMLAGTTIHKRHFENAGSDFDIIYGDIGEMLRYLSKQCRVPAVQRRRAWLAGLPELHNLEAMSPAERDEAVHARFRGCCPAWDEATYQEMVRSKWDTMSCFH